MGHRAHTGVRNSVQTQFYQRLQHWARQDQFIQGWTPPTNIEPVYDSVTNTPLYSAFSTEACNGATEGTATSAGNTVFDLFNSPGTSTFRQPPTINTGTMVDSPVVGDAVIEFKTDTRVNKDNNSIPGTANGGATRRVWYYRFYVYMVGAPTVASCRLFVAEESAADGGSDISCVGTGTAGKFALFDGVTVGSNSTRVGISDWTRVEVYCNQRSQTQEMRLFFGANLHGPSASPSETLTHTLASTDELAVWGIGMYTGASTPLYFAGATIGEGNWPGPVTGARPHTGDKAAGFGGLIKPYQTVAA